MPNKTGPCLKVVTAPAVIAPFVVAIAAVWGLDWRWIVTVVLVSVAVLFVGGWIDSQLEERAKAKALREEFKAAMEREPGMTLLPPNVAAAFKAFGKNTPQG
ncbi:MAG TPA: hypothetical protein VK611_26150 [Acidimicrobiales bacterium]|nr:hypothetical protein [Acidimicrobiales bacterium]